MMKKLLLPILAVYMLTHVGCTSSDSVDESDVAVSDEESFAEEGEGDFAEGEESSDSEESGEEVAEGEEGEESAEGEGEEVAEGEGEEAAEGEEVADGEEAAEGEGDVDSEDIAMEEGGEEDEFPEEVADEETQVAEGGETAPSDESLFTADNGAATETAPAEPPPTTAEAAPPVDNQADDLFKSTPRVAVAPVYAPLQKIKDAPFEKNGTLLNRVYVARPGDNWKSISQKIYAADRSSDLKKWNQLGRSPKTGDKIYYNSPKNPQDAQQMLTYYEDMGVQPQVYEANEGENIRDIAKNVLGNREGWKELWVTNLDVASKGALPAGTQLKYWKEGSETAMATPPTDPMAGGQPPADPTTMPPTDPTAMANNGAPPTDPMAGGQPPMDPTMMPPAAPPVDPQPGDLAGLDATGQPNSPETAPPPVAGTMGEPPNNGMPPPAEPDPIKKKAPATAEVAPADQDTTLMLGVCGVALVLLVGVVVIMRKNRARRIDLSQTQV